MKSFITFFFLLLFFCIPFKGNAQESRLNRFFEKKDSLDPIRFYSSAIFTTSCYTGFSYGLYNAWYKEYGLGEFHFFNDWNAWENMDKFGHTYTAYFQGVLGYKGARWTGLSKNKSILTGVLMGTIFQGTIEVMDGFADKWGFSGYDMAFNGLGSAAFALQQYYWDEQRISFKISSHPVDYPNLLVFSDSGTTTVSLTQRAENLFGSNYTTRFLKDYNGQTYWASINIKSFLKESSNFPNWLNLSLGYSVENLFGGYENTWEYKGINYTLPPDEFVRYHQFFISIDYDLWKIRTSYAFANTFLDILNIFKLPAPAIEFNSLGEVHFHIFYF